MKKVIERPSRARTVLITIVAIFFVIFVIIPLSLLAFDGEQVGNVAVIPIEGVITGDGESYLGQGTVSSQTITEFIAQAELDPQIKIIVLEINSPGGSAVASDEVASAVKKVEKPVVALIREVGASGGYWIASAADHIIANRMSITGSIGVISSYLEFSGLMERYGIGYERLVAGKYKDVGTPYQKLQDAERNLLQQKMDLVHEYFIEEVAANRKLSVEAVRKFATGEFFLGVEAQKLGLVDELGNRETVETYLQEKYALESVDYVTYEQSAGLFDIFSSVISSFSFKIGQGIGSIFLQKENPLMVV